MKKYNNSPENILLLNKIKDKSLFPENIIIEFKNLFSRKMNKELTDNSLFQWHDRAYNLQCKIDSFNNKSLVLCINISVVIPYYICYILEIEHSEKSETLKFIPRRNFVIENGLYLTFLEQTKIILEKEFHVKEFPKELLYESIKGINFQDIEIEKFNYFNAFFLNDYFTNYI